MVFAVHPRGCGEYDRRRAALNLDTGSSPRVRGILKPILLAVLFTWFIPAGAGNTTTPQATLQYRAVHPRGCGEYVHEGQAQKGLYGSSPRVRGIRTGAAPGASMCGSSPRVRGILLLRLLKIESFRFIPAGAGNTRRPHPHSHGYPVHPRGCGEYSTFPGFAHLCDGSSPRVRGIRGNERGAVLQCRFIPAGAGNTTGPDLEGPGLTVHPRGCGEYGVCSNAKTYTCGSSPRVRGIRACCSRTRRGGGSSPRVRGILAHSVEYLCEQRFIPAGAGNTP